MSAVVRPHESDDPVTAVLRAHESGRSLALSTSGTTTGGSREVVRSTDSWWRSFEAYGRLAGVDDGSRVWVPGPPTSTMNLFALVHARVVGARVADRAADATAACLTPNQLTRALPDLPPGAVVVVAGAALPNALAELARDRDMVVESYYGAAELSFVAWASREGLRPFPGVEIAVRDEPVDGTIWVRSPYLCEGYRGGAGSMATDPDGWATVGDVGTVEDGILTVLGRPDAIVTAGATVLLADVESELRRVALGELAVFGAPDPTRGQVVAVALVDAGDRGRIEQWARDRLPATHRPRRWVVLPELPHTPAGKVDRVRLASAAG